MELKELIEDLKLNIIDQLNLEDIDPATVNAEDPLFGDGLGLDSIDALELIVLMERQYEVKIEDESKGREIMATLKSMAQYIQANKPKVE